MFSKLYSVGLLGMDAFCVETEAYLSAGLPAFDLVGLPDTAVRESRERVRAAVKNSGFDFPVSRITVNLAPADVRKEGAIYDLPIFLSLLKASGQLSFDDEGCMFVGELSLSGALRPASGVLAMAMHAQKAGFHSLYVPAANGTEAALVQGLRVYAVSDVGRLIAHFKGEDPLSPVVAASVDGLPPWDGPDFCDVMGQAAAKRALEVAAAGGHNVMLIGPPGSGKSMLAKRLPSILPAMTFEECMDTTKLHSIAGTLSHDSPLLCRRPYRSPHHTVSPPGLSGGGTVPRPGELSLAHNGVLFLDELPEFSRAAMEVLRQPLEDGQVTISRAACTLSYPCNVMLVAAMNPCPCGYFGHPTRPCTCPKGAASRYLGRVSGPLLDRLDIHIEVPPVDFESLASDQKAEGSKAIGERVNTARRRQQQRYQGTGVSCNATLTPAMLRSACPMTDEASAFLRRAFDRLGMSARAYDRVLKVARTITDLSGQDKIDIQSVSEAVQYRSLDRKYWRT